MSPDTTWKDKSQRRDPRPSTVVSESKPKRVLEAKAQACIYEANDARRTLGLPSIYPLNREETNS